MSSIIFQVPAYTAICNFSDWKHLHFIFILFNLIVPDRHRKYLKREISNLMTMTWIILFLLYVNFSLYKKISFYCGFNFFMININLGQKTTVQDLSLINEIREFCFIVKITQNIHKSGENIGLNWKGQFSVLAILYFLLSVWEK